LGERANSHSIPFGIANMLIELSSPVSAAEFGIEERLGPFFGSPESPLARVVLRWEECAQPPIPRGDLIYDPGSIWKMYRAGPDWYAALRYSNWGGAVQTQGVLRANPGWDDLTLSEHRTGAVWRGLLLAIAGELLLATKAVLTDGLVLHASGVDDNGQGVVFIGHSGAGKSTQLGLWSQESGVTPMNDDRIVVRVEARGPMCYGAPWGSTANITCNRQVPLSALILLEQAKENNIQRLSPSVSALLLLARTLLPYWDRELMQRAMTNLDAILSCVPVYRLRCRPEPEVVSVVRSVL